MMKYIEQKSILDVGYKRKEKMIKHPSVNKCNIINKLIHILYLISMVKFNKKIMKKVGNYLLESHV